MGTSHDSIGHPVSVRRATLRDANAVSRVLDSAFAEFRHLYTPEAYAASVPSETGIATRLHEGPLWVAERDSVVVGTVSAVQQDDLVMIRGMAVSPLARGLALGRTLLKSAEDFGHRQGCGQAALYTTAFLAAAIALYRSSGYLFTGEAESPNGTELLRMIKRLESATHH
jgi:ribosomal protein S18 acetylase RimI-like enzyme